MVPLLMQYLSTFYFGSFRLRGDYSRNKSTSSELTLLSKHSILQVDKNEGSNLNTLFLHCEASWLHKGFGTHVFLWFLAPSCFRLLFHALYFFRGLLWRGVVSHLIHPPWIWRRLWNLNEKVNDQIISLNGVNGTSVVRKDIMASVLYKNRRSQKSLLVCKRKSL